MSHCAKALVVSMLLASSHVGAKETGDARSGLALAREMCNACHAVLPGPARSNPPSAKLRARASVPGMTPLALTVALQTSHKTMPNITLEQKELGT